MLDTMLERAKHEKSVDIYGHVTCLRSQRNYMVQTEDQYMFVYDAVLEGVFSGNTEVPARNLYAHIQRLMNTGVDGLTLMEAEFKVGGVVGGGVGGVVGRCCWCVGGCYCWVLGGAVGCWVVLLGVEWCCWVLGGVVGWSCWVLGGVVGWYCWVLGGVVKGLGVIVFWFGWLVTDVVRR